MGLWVLLAQSHDRTVVDGPRCGAAKRQAATDVVPALTVPAEFPKGTRAFYIMKYEISQGQYADFLNGISHYAASFRAPFAGIGYYDERGTIRIEGSAYVASKPNRPANQMSWDDGTTFADWAGLRPMTELEFTKAARGPVDGWVPTTPGARAPRRGCCDVWVRTTTSRRRARRTSRG
jgi:formylglycine-generating enzyme required for sulfatase activity